MTYWERSSFIILMFNLHVAMPTELTVSEDPAQLTFISAGLTRISWHLQNDAEIKLWVAPLFDENYSIVLINLSSHHGFQCLGMKSRTHLHFFRGVIPNIHVLQTFRPALSTSQSSLAEAIIFQGFNQNVRFHKIMSSAIILRNDKACRCRVRSSCLAIKR